MKLHEVLNINESVDEDNGHPGFRGIANSRDELVGSIHGGYFTLDGTDLSGITNLDVSSEKLKSLKGCPEHVGGYFNCVNNQLKSLKYCPTEVGADFDCNDNKLESLKYCPTEVGGDFYCNRNKITRLDYLPKIVNGDFCIDHKIINPLLLMDIEGIESIQFLVEVGISSNFRLALKIINRCIKNNESMEEAMDQLLQAGLDEYAVI